MLHFVTFFQVASLFSIRVDNYKGLELDNSTVFHRGRQQKSSRAGQQNNFFIFWPHFSIKKITEKMQQIILLHSSMIKPDTLV